MTGKKIWPIHFIPALACWIYLISFLYFAADQKIYIFKNQGKGYEVFVMVNLVAIILSGITYVVWSLFILRRHRKAILDEFSYTEKINLRWLQFLIYGIGIIWLLVIATDEILFAGVVLFVILIGYFGLKQPGIIFPQRITGPLARTVRNRKKRG